MAKDDAELYRQIYEKTSGVEAISADATAAAAASVGGSEEAAVNELTEEVDEKLNLEGGSEEKKHQSRGGKALQRDEGAKLDKEAQKRAVNTKFHDKTRAFLFVFIILCVCL